MKLLLVASESKANRKALANLSIEVTEKQRLSEERITKALKVQTRLHKKDAEVSQRMMARILEKLGIDDTEQDSEDDDDEDRDDDYTDDDTIMKQAKPQGSSRTNHPKDKIIPPRSRTTKRVAARVMQ